MGQESLRSVLKGQVRDTAFQELLSDKEKCSKLKSLKYTRLELQTYLTNENKLTTKEKQVLFRWRSHMISVKHNMGKKDATCPLCKGANDTQYHLLTCPCLNLPQPWNIQSVIKAMRQREIILEEESKSTTSTRCTSL